MTNTPYLEPSELKDDHKRIKGKVERAWDKEYSQNKRRYFLKIDGEIYSGWGNVPAQEGDTVLLDYIEKESNGQIYKNIDPIQMIWDTHEQPTLEDYEEIEQVVKKEKPVDMEIKLRFADLLIASINWASKKNLDDKEIFPFFIRAIEYCGLTEEYEQFVQLNKREVKNEKDRKN